MSKVYFRQRYCFKVREKEMADGLDREAVILERRED